MAGDALYRRSAASIIVSKEARSFQLSLSADIIAALILIEIKVAIIGDWPDEKHQHIVAG